MQAGQVDADMALLWARWRKEGDAAARELLIGRHLPYARMLAATLYARRTHDDVDFDDYLQLARVGLIEAIDRFDPARGAQFKTFASRRVHGAVHNGLTHFTEKNQQIGIAARLRQERLDAIKEAVTPRRSPGELLRYLAEAGIGIALGILLESTGMIDADAFDGSACAPSPEVGYFRSTGLRQLRARLHGLVDQLAEQQKIVIRYHYQQEFSFDEIAATMGVTRARISQLHRQGLLRLRELLGEDARCDMFG